MKHIFIVIAILNLISFGIFGIDKFKAKRQIWRIPETTLLFFGLFGPVGAFIGMQFFRHKTKKWKFRFLIPLFIILNMSLTYYIITHL